ncbi:hypothetical protein [Aphanothece hegewaldii]|uniref:hypothetical protein n=1 Tax=Aphanothece hegewaldii TaxID=1521625 RepID=UPI0015E63636|nr:hypothetical protein [Aphanothece hegewaldii]
MLAFIGPNSFAPPVAPPLAPPLAPPIAPPKPPFGFKPGSFGGLLGPLLFDLVFPPPVGPTDAQEQQAIKNNPQNPGQDKGIEPPIGPDFLGGQVPGQVYLIKFSYEYVSDLAWGTIYYQTEKNASMYGIGPIVGFVHKDTNVGHCWHLRHKGGAEDLMLLQGSPQIAWFNAKEYRRNPFPQVTTINLLEVIPYNPPPGFKDKDKDPKNPGITSPGSNPPLPGLTPLGPGLNPLGPGINPPLPGFTPSGPGTNTNPGTNPGTNTSPGQNPGTNNNPGFDPLGNTKPNPGPAGFVGPGTSPNPGTNPGTNTSPGKSPSTTPGTNTSPGTKQNPGPITLLPPLFLPPGIDQKTGKNTGFSPVPEPNAPSVNTQPGPKECCIPVMGKLGDQDKKLDNIGDKLDKFNAGANAGQLAQLQEILERLGPKVNGGLSTFLTDKFTKLWQSSAVDRALSLMNLAASIHNAVMLSRNIGETLVAAFTNILALIGIKDPDGVSKSFSEAIGNTIESFIKGVIGAENYTELVTTWKKANRIYQAAINTYQLLTDSLFAVAEGLELVGKYTGKMGNALKKSGTILESSYDWFGETFNFKSKRNRAIQKVIEGLQGAQEVSSDLLEITENFREAQENINEMGEQINTIKAETQEQVTEKTTKETTGKTNSQTPDIPKSSMNKPSLVS